MPCHRVLMMMVVVVMTDRRRATANSPPERPRAGTVAYTHPATCVCIALRFALVGACAPHCAPFRWYLKNAGGLGSTAGLQSMRRPGRRAGGRAGLHVTSVGPCCLAPPRTPPYQYHAIVRHQTRGAHAGFLCKPGLGTWFLRWRPPPLGWLPNRREPPPATNNPIEKKGAKQNLNNSGRRQTFCG